MKQQVSACRWNGWVDRPFQSATKPREQQQAAIKDKHSFRAGKPLLGGNGIPSIGPGGTTVHIYKTHDTVTAKNLVVVLFVKDDTIVDYAIQDVAARHAKASQQ